MKILQGEFVRLEKFIVGSGGVSKGDLVVLSGTDVIETGTKVTAATVVGIAMEDGNEDDVVSVAIIVSGMKIRSKCTGAVLTALTDANLGTLFDLDDGQTVDLDDTTDGCCFCVGYDNEAGTIDFIIPGSFLYF